MSFANGSNGPVFTVPIPATSLTTGSAWDVFSIISTTGRVELMEVVLSQVSSSVAAIQALGVKMFRGSTGVSGGAALTAANALGDGGAAAAVATLTGPSSTVISTTSATQVHSEAMKADGHFRYRPHADACQVLATSQRLHLNVTTPSVAITVYGTVTFRQKGG